MFAADRLGERPLANEEVRHGNAFLNFATSNAAEIYDDLLRPLLDQILQVRSRIRCLSGVQTINPQNADAAGFHAHFGGGSAERAALHVQRQRPRTGAKNSQLHFRARLPIQKLARVIQGNVASGFTVDVFDDVAGSNPRLVRRGTFNRRYHVKKRSYLRQLGANPNQFTLAVSSVVLYLVRRQISRVRIQSVSQSPQRSGPDLLHVWFINVIALNMLKNTLEDSLLRARIIRRLLRPRCEPGSGDCVSGKRRGQNNQRKFRFR